MAILCILPRDVRSVDVRDFFLTHGGPYGIWVCPFPRNPQTGLCLELPCELPVSLSVLGRLGNELTWCRPHDLLAGCWSLVALEVGSNIQWSLLNGW